MPADGGIRFGNYVLLRRIARGGMAEVFLAQQRGLEGFDRRVAVKRILPHLADSPDFVKMFLGEAKLAAQLSHPNIVHIYDFGKVDHDYFIAMEYVEGVHAGQVFKQAERERISPALIARIGADAAAALHYAHELRGPTGKPLGIVHRDVSPANLMISYDGVVKLCDFGIAKAAALTDQRTIPGQVKGKYAYMSPEQTIGSPLDGRSDVFSLAIVLWELLAGRMIVPRGDAVAAMRAIRDGKLQPIAQAVPDLPAPLAEAIAWALATRREDRATAAGLATALEGFLKVAPELATPMQLGAWLRARFPREALTGPQRALADDGGLGTAASPRTVGGTAPGTAASPGTVGGAVLTAGTGARIAPVTPPAGAAHVDELSETHAITGDPDAGNETIIVEERNQPISKRITQLQMEPPARVPRYDPTLDDPALRAAMSTLHVEPPLPASPRAPAGAPPGVSPRAPTGAPDAPTLYGDPRGVPAAPPPLAPRALDPPLAPRALDPPLAPRALDPRLRAPSQQPLLTGTEAVSRVRRPNRRFALIGGLAGIAVASFLLALVVCSPRDRARTEAPAIAAAPDAAPGDTATPAPPDAAAAEVPAAPDAAPALPASPDAAEPAPPLPDAPPRLQLYKVDTRPTSGTIQIGDQRRAAPADFMLPPGKHTVVAELDGWQPETRQIELVEGADLTQEIQFTRRLHIVRAQQTGTLTVRTTPYSDVYIGTRKIGQAPFADKEVPAGTYWLTFKNPLHPTVRKQVTVTAGKLTKLPPFSLPAPD